MNFRLLVLISGVSVLVSCAKSSEQSASAPARATAPAAGQASKAPQVDPFASKTVQEVLFLKYDKATLKCDLWAQTGKEFDSSVAPNGTVTWDLLNDFRPTNRFAIYGATHRHQMEAVVTAHSLEIAGSVIFVDHDLTRYVMTYTPVIDLEVNLLIKTRFEPGVSGTATSIHQSPVYERVRKLFHSSSHALPPNGESSTFNRVECTIETEIKPQYQHQFEVQRAN